MNFKKIKVFILISVAGAAISAVLAHVGLNTILIAGLWIGAFAFSYTKGMN